MRTTGIGVLQILINSVIYASEIAIMAVGVSLTFSVLRFANFAHVQFAVVGGYLTYVFYVFLGVPVVLAALVERGPDRRARGAGRFQRSSAAFATSRRKAR